MANETQASSTTVANPAATELPAEKMGVVAAEQMAQKYFDRGYDKLAFAYNSLGLNQYAQELGVGDIAKQLNKDRLKTLLAAAAMIMIFKKITGNLGKLAIMGGAAFLVFKNKDMLSSLTSKEKYLEKVSESVVGEKIEEPFVELENDPYAEHDSFL